MGANDSHGLVSALKDLTAELGRVPTQAEFESRVRGARERVSKCFKSFAILIQAAGLSGYNEKRATEEPDEKNGPRVLFVDIETLPLTVYAWGLFDQNIGLNQIESDWTVLSWCAKWQDESEIFYQDVRAQKNVRNDKPILKKIWELLDEADVVVWHYGSAFDHKKLNARFILNGFRPPSPYKQIDTKKVASRHFGFTSNKLEYLTEKLNKKFHKSKHKKFEGFSLWKECMNRNMAAFREMEKYNRLDVLSLEELYKTLRAWDQKPDFNVYHNGYEMRCNCGSTNLQRRGFNHSTAGKYQRFQCQDCGAWMSAKANLLTKEKRGTLLRK